MLPLDSTSQQRRKSKSRPKTEAPAKKSSRTKQTNRSEKEVRREKSRADSDLKETRRQIKLNAEETSRKLSQLNLVEGEIEECNGRITTISTRIDSLNSRISTLNDSIEALDTHLRQITASYIKAIKRSQGRRQDMSALAFIFSSDSFAQAYRRMRYLRQFAKWREKRAGEITAAKKVLDGKRQRLTSLANAAAKSKDELSREHASLLKKQTETSNLIGELRNQGNTLKEVMAEQRAQAAALDRELDNVIAREAARREAERKAAEAEKARKAAEEEAARKAREAAAAEAAKKAAAEEAARKEAAAEAARKEAEKARKEARKEEERREAARKAAEAEEAKKAAKEAKEAARKAEAEAKRVEKERKDAEEKKKKEERRKKTKPVKHDQKSDQTSAQSGTDDSREPDNAAKDIAAGADFESLKGSLPHPVAGRYTIVKRFGRQQHPSLPHVVTDNAGIDIETAKGAAVRNVCDGEVSAVFRPNGYNTVVVIRHGNYMTVYANLAYASVTTGQKVKSGQSIGAVFSDPKDNGRSVLHFEVRKGRQKENPEQWLRK